MDIRFEEASVVFGAHTALHPVSLTLCEQRIGIIGLNGSGKTTFVRLINGLIKASAGRVSVNGIDPSVAPEAAARQAGMIFQNPANQIILPVVGEDIAFGLSRLPLTKSERADRVEKVLGALSISHLATRRSHELSGGELQLAALASVLVTEPALLILDEPTNQLDLKNRTRVLSALAALAMPRITITHDLDLAADQDRLLVFHEGRLAFDGAPEAALAHYRKIAQ